MIALCAKGVFVVKSIKLAVLIIALSSTAFITNAYSKEEIMPGPAQNGVLVYSNNPSHLAEFYEKLFDMKVVRKTQDFISLDKDGFNLIIHVPPFELPKETFNPVKLFLTVDNMENTRNEVSELGGKVFDGEWKNPIFKVSNIADCDGNHIQLREFLSDK